MNTPGVSAFPQPRPQLMTPANMKYSALLLLLLQFPHQIRSDQIVTIVRVLFADQGAATVSLAGVHPALQLAGAHHLRDDGLAGVGVEPDTGLLLDQRNPGGPETLGVDAVSRWNKSQSEV